MHAVKVKVLLRQLWTVASDARHGGYGHLFSILQVERFDYERDPCFRHNRSAENGHKKCIGPAR
jgi:hypothetical protein